MTTLEHHLDTPSSARFWDKIADTYAARPVADAASYEKKLAITREYLTPESVVLEFACGTGSTSISHAPFARQILATDIAGGMIDIARRKAEAMGVDNVTFERAALEDLPVEAGYDMVMGHSILHLLPDVDGVVARVHGMLKPGGVFVSSTTCLGDTMPWIRFIVPVGRALGKMPYVNVFKVSELIDSLVKGGFEVERQFQPGKGKAIFLVARKPA